MKVLENISPALAEGLRRYEENPLDDPIQARVKNHYYAQHRFQSVEFVKSRVTFKLSSVTIWMLA